MGCGCFGLKPAPKSQGTGMKKTCQGTGTWQIQASGANRVGYMKNG